VGYQQQYFGYTGATQTFSVTATSAGTITFDVQGGAGMPGGSLGPGSPSGGAGGPGSRITGSLQALNGDNLTLYVASQGGTWGYHTGGAAGHGNSVAATPPSYTYQGSAGGVGGSSSAILYNGSLVVEAAGGGGGSGGTAWTGGVNGGAGGIGATAGGATGTSGGGGGPGNGSGGPGGTGGYGDTSGPYGFGGATVTFPGSGGPGAAGTAGGGAISPDGGAGGNCPAGADGGGGGGGGAGAYGGGGGGSGAHSFTVMGTAGGGGGGGQSRVTNLALTSTAFDGTVPAAGSIALTYLVGPAVTVTSPSSTQTATSQPSIGWAYSSPASSPQTSYTVVVFEQPPGGWPPGLDGTGRATSGQTVTPAWSTSGFGVATSVTVGVGLANGDYRAYVQVADTGPGQETSPWAYIEWTQNVGGPNTPAGITATPYAQVARVLVTIPASAPPPAYNIQRSTDSGVTWTMCLGGAGFASTPTNTYFWDRGAPREIALQYRVQPVNASIVGSWSATFGAYLFSDGNERIVSAGQSSLDGVLIRQGPNLEGLSHEDQAVYFPEGRTGAVVVGGTIHTEQFISGTGSALLIFAFPNDATWYNFLTMRARKEPVLLQTVYGDTGGLEQFWLRVGPDAGTSRFGGGDRGGVGQTGRGQQIRTVQIAGYVVTEPAATVDTTPPGQPTVANTTASVFTGGVVPDGVSISPGS
jgi:hypothetical protein